MEHLQVRPTQAPIGAHEGARAGPEEASLVDVLLEETRDDEQGRPRYSSRMNSLLAIASSWAYSDAETLSMDAARSQSVTDSNINPGGRRET